MSESTQSRQVARRAFADEFNAAGHTFNESDEERAPTYLLLPTGQKANRVFVVGTLTETEDVGSDSEYWRGRVVDPTGTFFLYAGQYQQDQAATLRQLEPPAYVAVVGKPRTYEPDDGEEEDEVYVSIRPETISEVDGAVRDRWVVETADHTIERLKAFDDAGTYSEMAREQYGPDLEAFREMVIGALESMDEEGDDESGSQEAEQPPEAASEAGSADGST
jgi:hypothetical protein